MKQSYPVVTGYIKASDECPMFRRVILEKVLLKFLFRKIRDI